MQITENFDLTNLNTFGIPAKARFGAVVESEEDLKELFHNEIFRNNEKLFLGGGSNVLLTQDFPGIVVINKIKGIEVLEESEESVTLRAYGGEVWHDLVLFAIEKGLWGIENLSLIPGSVGAAPMQNIGAYGAELKNVIQTVEAYDINSSQKKIFTKEECNFGYRDSIFKQELKGKYFILAITIKLNKIRTANIEYRVLRQYLSENKIEVKTSKDVSEAVSAIRRSKLPDPKVIGNAGSFFKNVFMGRSQLEQLLKKYPDMPYFEEGEVIKIPAAWLIESSGWKGKREGSAGVHDRQALVLVNHGGATGKEIRNLAERVIESVYSKFGIRLETEVNLI